MPAQRQPSGEGQGSRLAPGLHLVATPIGNLGDLAPRALAALRDADLVVCEDTRVTGKLLRLCDAARPLTAYHEHNAARVRPQILARLRAGASVALVSDAGTPLVSDPGYKLVREAIAQGSPVVALPGPSAALAALTVSGLPSDRFSWQVSADQGRAAPPGDRRARRRAGHPDPVEAARRVRRRSPSWRRYSGRARRRSPAS